MKKRASRLIRNSERDTMRPEYDFSGGVRDVTAVKFAQGAKNSESVILPEAGHSAYWEQPEMFNRAVLEFIRKH